MAKKVKASKKSEKSFEACMAELETIQERLGSGELQLDQAIQEYENGVKYLKECYGLLEKVEKRITILTSDGKGGLKEQPFRDGDSVPDDEDEDETDDEDEDDDGPSLF